jgi:hypothetical protein
MMLQDLNKLSAVIVNLKLNRTGFTDIIDNSGIGVKGVGANAYQTMFLRNFGVGIIINWFPDLN